MQKLDALPESAAAGFRANLSATLTISVMLIVAGFGVFYQREHANVVQRAAETARVASQLAAHASRSAIDLHTLADVPDARIKAALTFDPIKNQIEPTLFGQMFVVDATSNSIVANSGANSTYAKVADTVARQVASLAWRMQAVASGAAADDVTGRIPGSDPAATASFISLDDGLYSASVAALPPSGQAGAKPEVLVGLQRVDDRFLADLAKAADIAPVSLSAADASIPDRASLALGLPDASVPMLLSWQPQRPGDGFLISFGLAMAACAMLIAGLLILQAQRALAQLRISEARARKLAGFDLLSGLPNRFLFGQFLDQEFARAERGGGPFALFFLDIDRFKEINDSYGHDAGDAMIVGVTERISSVLRAGDKLARYGGDEFAILQTEIAGPKDVEELASRIYEAMALPVNVGEQHMMVRLSTGIALYPQDALLRQDLMRNVDEALARAKSEGRNRYMFFQKRVGEDMRSRRTTEDELRKAIASGDLVIYYQPIVTADGARMVGVEALVRWQHPLHGLVQPDNFISLAEDRGLILPLGEFVLRQACRDGCRWAGVRVAVNVSPLQFRQPDFVGMVARVLAEEQFDPARLELELTEGVVIADADQAENVMMDLRALGVRLALDDFGTGYSSLVYLRRFAFDKIKIDRSFLESMEATGESAIIVHSIIHLGRSLGLTVTAEGIETGEQHRFLQAAGAHELQGYLFSKPVPREAIDLLAEAQVALGTAPLHLRSVA